MVPPYNVGHTGKVEESSKRRRFSVKPIILQDFDYVTHDPSLLGRPLGKALAKKDVCSVCTWFRTEKIYKYI